MIKYLNLSGEIKFLFNEKTNYSDYTVLTEGAIDTLTLVQNGYNSVGLFGVHSYKDHIRRRMERRCDIIYLCLDGDPPGREASVRIAKNNSKKYKIITLPDGEDPNSYLLTHSKEEFQILFDQAKDVITYQIDLLAEKNDTALITEKIAPILEDISKLNKIDAEVHLKYLKEKLELNSNTMQAIRSELIQFRKEGKKSKADKKDSSDNVERKAIFPGLVDLVENNEGEVNYLIKKDDQLILVSNYEKDGKIYIPPKKEAIPYLLPRADKVFEHYDTYQQENEEDIKRKLFKDIVALFKKVSRLPKPYHYTICALWVFHTYLLEQFQCSPYLCFVGPPERGKTRIGKALAYLSYRGVHVESMREAYIIRLAQNFCATIFFDCKRLWYKTLNTQTEDILLLRFDRGAIVPKVLFPERGAFEDTVFYGIFGASIFATNDEVDQILSTRCITIRMPKVTETFSFEVTPESCLSLKERLIAFRAKYLDTKLPSLVKPFPGRLGDITLPLYQLKEFIVPELEDEFMILLHQQETERAEHNAYKSEAKILKVLINTEGIVEQGRLSVKLVTDGYNRHQKLSYQMSYKSMGWKLKSLGFKKATLSDGTKAILFDKGLIKRLIKKFDLEYLLKKKEHFGFDISSKS